MISLSMRKVKGYHFYEGNSSVEAFAMHMLILR